MSQARPAFDAMSQRLRWVGYSPIDNGGNRTMTEDITLVLEFANPDWGDCALCGEHLLDDGLVGIAVRGGGRVCEDCTDKHSPLPGGYEIARALSHIDMALTAASPQYRPGLLALFPAE